MHHEKEIPEDPVQRHHDPRDHGIIHYSRICDEWHRTQVETVVNNVVFPVIDLVLAVMFFVKVGTCYFEYKKHGSFEFTGPAILFACLIFTLTAPLYIWTII